MRTLRIFSISTILFFFIFVSHSFAQQVDKLERLTVQLHKAECEEQKLRVEVRKEECRILSKKQEELAELRLLKQALSKEEQRLLRNLAIQKANFIKGQNCCCKPSPFLCHLKKSKLKFLECLEKAHCKLHTQLQRGARDLRKDFCF